MTQKQAPEEAGNTVSVTRLLQDWRGGDAAALDRLTPLVYDSLRQLAKRHMRGERADHTLQATAVVHEAYAQLVEMEVAWQDRAHFYALAARMMRRILVDYARSRRRAKRGGDRERVTLAESQLAAGAADLDLLALDDGLQRLAAFDERKAQVVELHFFAGLNYDETAAALGISPATVDRDLRLAKAWLYRELAAS